MQNILVNNRNAFCFDRIIDNLTLPFLTFVIGLNEANIDHYKPFLRRLRYLCAQPEENLSSFILNLVPLCPKARFISYQITTFLSEKQFENIIKNCPLLEDFGYPFFILDVARMAQLPAPLPKLKKLSVRISRSEQIAVICDAFPNLTHLMALSQPSKQAFPGRLCKAFGKIVEMSLTGFFISPQTVGWVAEMPFLRSFGCGFSNLDDQSCAKIAESMPDLEELDVFDCQCVSFDGIKKIAALRKLRSLDMRLIDIERFDLMELISDKRYFPALEKFCVSCYHELDVEAYWKLYRPRQLCDIN